MADLSTRTKSYFYWRGGLGILLGVLIIIWPKLTILILVTLLSIWLLLIGVISIIEGVASIRDGGLSWLVDIVMGLLELGVGVYLVQRPTLTTLTIITLLGLVFVVRGAVYLYHSFIDVGHRLLSLILSVLSFVAGIWLWRYPFHGSLAFVWLLGLYAIASGAMLVAMGAETPDV